MALVVPSLSGQVLVYKVDVKEAKGINFHTFEGGYVVAPLLGGEVSFLLTTTDGGRQYVESPSGGRLFTAVDGGSSRKSVLSAVTGSGTAGGAMVVMGDINHSVRISNPSATITAKVARTLSGTLVSADDEAEAETTAEDGSIGSAGFAEVKLTLDEDETNRVNRDDLTLEQALEHLKLELARQGYTSAEATTPPTEEEETAEETEVEMETSPEE